MGHQFRFLRIGDKKKTVAAPISTTGGHIVFQIHMFTTKNGLELIYNHKID